MVPLVEIGLRMRAGKRVGGKRKYGLSIGAEGRCDDSFHPALLRCVRRRLEIRSISGLSFMGRDLSSWT